MILYRNYVTCRNCNPQRKKRTGNIYHNLFLCAGTASPPPFHAWLQGTYVFGIPIASYIRLTASTPFAASPVQLPAPSSVRYVPVPPNHTPLPLLPPPPPNNSPSSPSNTHTHTQTMLPHHPISTPDNTTSPTPPHQHCPPPSIIWPHRHSTDYRWPDRIVIDGFPPT